MFRRMRTWVVTVLVVAGLAVGGWYAFGHKNKPSTSSTKVTTVQTTNSSGATTTQKYIETADFKYAVPSGWVELDKNALDRADASSGIGRLASYAATFRTKTDVLPANDTDLKTNALNDVKKNAPNFKQLSSIATKVDNKSGQEFVYTFTDQDGKNKVRQQLSAIPIKEKNQTYLLLFSSPDSVFDNQVNDFKAILDSFKFK